MLFLLPRAFHGNQWEGTTHVVGAEVVYRREHYEANAAEDTDFEPEPGTQRDRRDG